MNQHIRMRNQRLGLECSTSPLAHAAHTGFLEAIILTAVTNSAVFALGPAAVSLVTSGLTALATTAISLGINYLLSPKPPKPADGKVPREQPMPPVIFGVGTNRISGAAMLKEEKDNYYYLIRAIAGHRVHQFKRHWLHDDIVVVNGSDMVDRSAVTGDDKKRYGKDSNLVKMQYRLGLDTETAYADAVTAFAAEDIWTNDHRGDGTASAFMRCKGVSSKSYAETFPYGAPQPSDEVDMALVWDFRDDDQDPDDQSTWTFSKNAALCYAWWLCFCPYGPRRDYTQALLPYLDRWKEEADICDEDVPLAAGGTEKRYEVNTWATTETDPIAIQNVILSACDGHIAQMGDGGLVLTVGKFREELVGEMTDADIVGHTVHNDVLEEDEINRLVPKFVYPATEYTQAVTDYFESATDQAEIGQVLSQEADYAGVQQWRQARRLGKREWQRLQMKKSGTLDCRMSGINEVTKRWVRLNTPVRLPALNGKIIEIKRAFLALKNGGFQIEWALHPDDIDAWTPATDEGAAPPVPTKPNSKGVPAAVITSMSALGNGSSVFLRVVLGDPLDDTVTPVLRYRIKTTGQWVEQEFPTAALSSGVYTLDTNPVQANETFEVQAAFVGSRGTYGEWSTPAAEIVAEIGAVSGMVYVQADLDDDSAGWSGYTLRQVIDQDLLSSATGTKVKVTFAAANSAGFTIDAAYIGYAAASGDPCDFEAAPTQLKFGGANGITASAGQTVATDAIAFTPQTGKDLIVSMHFSAASAVRRKSVLTGWAAYYKAAVSEAGTIDVSGYGAGGENAAAVSRIELIT